MATQGRKRGKALPRGAEVPSGGPQEATLTVTRLEQLKALSHPLRQQLFEQFARGARTTKQVADSLGEKVTRLYHHVASLEDAGLIELVATRPVRGTIEKYYEAVARTVRIDPALLAGDDGGAADAAMLDIVDGVLGKARSDVAQLLAEERGDTGEPQEEVMFLPVEIGGSEHEVRQVREKIDALVADLRALGGTAGGSGATTHRLLIGWYPLPRSGRRND